MRTFLALLCLTSCAVGEPITTGSTPIETTSELACTTNEMGSENESDSESDSNSTGTTA